MEKETVSLVFFPKNEKDAKAKEASKKNQQRNLPWLAKFPRWGEKRGFDFFSCGGNKIFFSFPFFLWKKGKKAFKNIADFFLMQVL